MDSRVTEQMVTLGCAKCHKIIDVSDLEPGDGITCPYCGDEFIITRQFGNFLLEELIGTGGMGAVYGGRDVTLNRAVAVKVLKPGLVVDRKFMATFLQEAEITASLNHPNIVQVYAFGEHDGVYYLVVEHISGGSLNDKIIKLNHITELEGIEIGIAVARGLECAQQRGLIHRDVKPGNILFDTNHTPKVIDFGLSLSFDTTDHFEGEIWGTPYYVAPEKLQHEKETFQSDLYSLGATLFHAISGRPPYDGGSPDEVAHKHLKGNVISLKAFVPGISDQTAYAVSKAMARYPEDRYESYAAFIAQLEDAKRRITDPNFHITRKQAVTIIENASESRYKHWLSMGLLFLVVALIGFLAWKGPQMLGRQQTSQARDLTDYVPQGPSTINHSQVVPVVPPVRPPTVSPTPAAPSALPTPAAPQSGGGLTKDTFYLENPDSETVNVLSPTALPLQDGFKPRSLSSPITWTTPAPLHLTAPSDSWTVSIWTTPAPTTAIVRVDILQGNISIGSASMDVNASGGGNHETLFHIPITAALNLTDQPLGVRVTQISGQAVMVLADGDFRSYLTWSPKLQ